MYQLVTSLLQPYPILLLSLLVVLLYTWRNERPWRRSNCVALAMVVLLCVLSMMQTGHLAMGSLEWPYPPTAAVPGPDDTIVVLAGNAYVDNEAGTAMRVGDETMYRCLHALQLYKKAGGCHVVVSGGKPVPAKPEAMTLAEAMRDFLVTAGVDPEDFTLETNSTTTFENARQTSQLLGRRPGSRVFLVTSASHMRRAAACFRRQGIVVVPAPCNHQALRLDFSLTNFVPSVEGIRGVQRALHEWLGIGWYWLRGRI
jgi:uncharacterized SAM-binding protein YcdF (DUF218 family)